MRRKLTEIRLNKKNMIKTQNNIMGPILHPAQLTFYTDAWVVASLQLAQSVPFPPPPRVGKLGNDLAPQGAVRCYFAVSEYNSATNQEIPGLKC